MLPATKDGQSLDRSRGCKAPIECETRNEGPMRESNWQPEDLMESSWTVMLLVKGMKVDSNASKTGSPFTPEPGH